MSLPLAILAVLGGLTLLAVGGEILVRGAVHTARRLQVSTAVIGLTIVAMATSLPELAVSVAAALRGNPDVAVGNVIGSNIFNLAVILGVSAILFPPLRFRASLIRFDITVMTASAVIMIFFARDGHIVRRDGILFLVLLTIFLVFRARSALTPDVAEGEGGTTEIESELREGRRGGLFFAIFKVVAGAAMLTGGAQLLVPGAVTIAEFAGVSERVIALTLVSAGTGLPELATAIVAGRRGHSAVAVGNVIGSNIFNVFGIMGTTALVASSVDIQDAKLLRDLWWMLGFSVVALLPVLRPSRSIPRWEGILALAIYVLYLATQL